MADALDSKKISAFTDNAAPADTDYFLNATGNVMKKTKVSQLITWLKEKLGVNSLNTKLSGRKVVTKTFSGTISNGYSGENWNVSLSGYKPVYVTGYWLYSTSWYAITRVWLDVDNETLSITMRQIMGASENTNFTFQAAILYEPV